MELTVCEIHVSNCDIGKNGGLYHLWFHPFNLDSDGNMLADLKNIVEKAYQIRNEGKIEIVTMKQFARMMRDEKL